MSAYLGPYEKKNFVICTPELIRIATVSRFRLSDT